MLSLRLAAISAAFIISVHAAPLRRPRISHARRSGTVVLNKRLHINGIIAGPGTVELDFGGLDSLTTRTWTLPSAVKWTPAGKRTELSAAFDSVSSAITTDGRITRFSDRLTFAATTVVYDHPRCDIAFAPVVTTFLHGESGLRAGANLIARCDSGPNTISASAVWTAATSPTDTNPSGVWDWNLAVGRVVAKRWTPHANVLLEKTTGFTTTAGLFAGVEYQLHPRAALDLSWLHYGILHGAVDNQWLASVTWTLGQRK